MVYGKVKAEISWSNNVKTSKTGYAPKGRPKNYRGPKLTHGIWQGQDRNIMVKQCKDIKNRAKPLKGGQKLPWAKNDPWSTKGLIENQGGSKLTHGRPNDSQKLPWVKIDPRKTKG